MHVFRLALFLTREFFNVLVYQKNHKRVPVTRLASERQKICINENTKKDLKENQTKYKTIQEQR